MKLQAPDTITFTPTSFCPGCGHGLAVRLIAETVQEMGLNEELIAVVDVACGSLNIDTWRFDTVMAAHGRPLADAIGIKSVRQNNPVMAYIGDGAAYSIGIAETVFSAVRNNNIIVFVINNTIFGMTGGQMAPTTLPHQKTTSSPAGKDPDKYGEPFDITKIIGNLDIAYLARGALAGVKGIRDSKKFIKKAFEKHLRREGFCLVELLSPCPTNLNMKPVDCAEHIQKNVQKYFATGEFVDKGGETS